jgi:hypothetical protein
VERRTEIIRQNRKNKRVKVAVRNIIGLMLLTMLVIAIIPIYKNTAQGTEQDT